MAIANTAHGGTGAKTSTSGTTFTVTVTAVAGEAIVVAIATTANTPTTGVLSVADNVSNNYYRMVTAGTASPFLELWVCPKSSGSATTITITLSSGLRASAAASTYTGILGYGQTTTVTSAATVSLATALQTNNWILAAMADTATGSVTYTATAGTLRNTYAGATNNYAVTTIDNTSNVCTVSAPTTNRIVAVEIWASNPPTARAEGLDDTTFTQLMLMNYNLQPPYTELDLDKYNWGWKPPTLSTARNEDIYEQFTGMQIAQFGLQYPFTEQEVDLESFGYKATFSGSSMQMGDFKGFWARRPAMAEYEDFGTNIQVVTTAISGFDQDDLPVVQFFGYPFTEQEDELVNFTPPVVVSAITPFDEDQFLITRNLIVQHTDDDKVDATFFALEQFGEVQEYGPLTPSYFVPELSSDQDKTDATFFALEQFGEVQEYGPPPSSWFVRDLNTDYDKVDSTFFSLEQYPDDGTFSPQQQLTYLMELTEQDVAHATFFALEQFADVDDQVFIAPVRYLQTTDEDKVDSTFFSLEQYSDDGSQDIVKQWSIIPEETDTQFLVLPPGALPNMLYDAEFNPPQQQSYLFGSEDLEKYNWGWLPPLTKASEDDSPYDSPIWITQPLVQWADDDKTDSTFFTKETYSDFEELYPVSGWSMHQESDYDSAQSTFFALEQFSDVDEQPSIIVPRMYAEDELFGFNLVVSVKISGFDEDEGIPIQRPIMDDDTNWGFNLVVPVKISGFDQDEYTPSFNWVRSDDEVIAYEIPWPQTDEQVPLTKNLIADDVVEFSVQPLLSFNLEENPSQKSILLPEMNVETFGWRIPPLVLAYDSEENPPFQRSFVVPSLEDDAYNFGWVAPQFIPVAFGMNVKAVLDVVNTGVMKKVLANGVVTVGLKTKVK